MHPSNQDVERLVLEGVDALRAGITAPPADRFEAVTRTGRANAQVWLLLATACRADNDRAAEEAVLDHLLRFEPRTIRGRIMKGGLPLRGGGHRFGARPVHERLADRRGAGRRRGSCGRAAAGRSGGDADERRAPGQARGGAGLAGRAARRPQRALPNIARHLCGRASRSSCRNRRAIISPACRRSSSSIPPISPGSAALEAATGAIRGRARPAAERRGQRASGPTSAVATPIRPRARRQPPCSDSMPTGALSSFARMARLFDEVIARCPRTWEAVQAAPLPRMANSPTVMFSLLRPGARIAAAYGHA